MKEPEDGDVDSFIKKTEDPVEMRNLVNIQKVHTRRPVNTPNIVKKNEES